MLVQLDAEKVKRARKTQGLTQQDLAAAAGNAPKTLIRAEHGETIRVRSARGIISALGSSREGLGGRPARRS
jgi:transcriptional regulator with XRE-family HTH domain